MLPKPSINRIEVAIREGFSAATEGTWSVGLKNVCFVSHLAVHLVSVGAAFLRLLVKLNEGGQLS